MKGPGVFDFDHIAVGAQTLAAATKHVEAALGVSLQPGGEHAVYGTHNTLLGLQDGFYLEAIAVNPGASPQQEPRWFDLDRFHGPARLSNWICRCDDLDATLAKLPGTFGTPVSLTRGDLRWRMAVPASGVLPFDNCAPALMEWEGDAHPSARLATCPLSLTRFTVSHPEAAELEDLLAPFLADPCVRFVQGLPRLEAVFAGAGEERVLR